MSSVSSIQYQLPISSDDLLNILKDNQVDLNYTIINHYIHQMNQRLNRMIFPTNTNSVHIKNLFLRDKKREII